MSDKQEDMGAFNSWDCFGATLMLGVTPGIICYATTDPHDIVTATWLCIGGVLIALVVLAIALITRWKGLGTVVNGVGLVASLAFIVYVVLFWLAACDESAKAKSAELDLPAQQQTRPQ